MIYHTIGRICTFTADKFFRRLQHIIPGPVCCRVIHVKFIKHILVISENKNIFQKRHTFQFAIRTVVRIQHSICKHFIRINSFFFQIRLQIFIIICIQSIVIRRGLNNIRTRTCCESCCGFLIPSMICGRNNRMLYFNFRVVFNKNIYCILTGFLFLISAPGPDNKFLLFTASGISRSCCAA